MEAVKQCPRMFEYLPKNMSFTDTMEIYKVAYPEITILSHKKFDN
jgi:hypothetical protein